MSETAKSLIKSSLRSLGVIASGEEPTTTEYADCLESLRYMLRAWSGDHLMLYYISTDTITLMGATYYTLGPDGDVDTVRPTDIVRAYTTDYTVTILGHAEYRRGNAGVWYNPEYPLGKLYVSSEITGTLYVDSMKELSEPANITETMSFPPMFDEAVKYNLALRLAPEFGKEPTPFLVAMASEAKRRIETRNFVLNLNTVRPEIVRIASQYNIDLDDGG